MAKISETIDEANLPNGPFVKAVRAAFVVMTADEVSRRRGRETLKTREGEESFRL